MVMVVFIQPTFSRKLLAGLFVGLTVLFDFLSGSLGGDAYYLLAGTTDVLMLVVLANIKATWLSIGLAQVCLTSIFANYIGWKMWASSGYPSLYTALFVLIYSYAILVMLREERDVRDNNKNVYYYWFHTAFTHRLQFIFNHKKKI